jgi:hypothetical protein
VQAALAAGDTSIRALLGRVELRSLARAAWRATDPDGATLVDVDTPADLGAARSGARVSRGPA